MSILLHGATGGRPGHGNPPAPSSPPATKLTITTQPSSAVSTGVAFLQQPVIQLRDVSNNPVSQSGVVVTAAIGTGSNTLGGTLTATTNSSGVATFTNLSLTGSPDDTDTLSFTASGLTSATSNNLTIDPTGPGPGAHEPVGMTMLLTHDGSSVQPNAAWDFAFAIPERGTLSTVTDSEKGSVVQLAMTPVTWPGEGSGGLTAGNAASNTWASAFAPTKVYMAWWHKLNTTYVGNNGSGGEKDIWLFAQHGYFAIGEYVGLSNAVQGGDPTTDYPSGNVKPCYLLEGSALVAMEGLTFGSAAAGFIRLPFQSEAGDLGNVWPKGDWAFFELVRTFNSRGNADGSFQMWINGTAYPKTSQVGGELVGLTATGMQRAEDVCARLTSINFSNTWGGGGTVLSANNQKRIKNLYVSGGYARSGEAPSNWVLALAPGQPSTPPAGTSVELIAQLVDGNGNSVDILGQYLQPAVAVIGPATSAIHNDPAGAPYTQQEHGTVLIRIDVSGGALSGADVAISLGDYARVSNNTANGTHRTSNTLHLTVA